MRLGNIEGTAAPNNTHTTGKTNNTASSNRTGAKRIAASLVPAAAILLFQQVLFPVPSGVFLRGLIVGSLTALVALGLALVHRASGIVNFAQADLGFVPAVLVFLLLTESGLPWGAAVATGLASAVLLGAGAERVVMRRFFQAPRMLATVATVGISLFLSGAATVLPNLWGMDGLAGPGGVGSTPRMPAPFEWSAGFGGTDFDVNDLLALAIAPAGVAFVLFLLYRSNLGTAIRAGGDSPDRALMLGVPVFGLQHLVWTLVAALGFVALFLRSGIVGLPLLGPLLAFGVLLRALAAFLLGRLTGPVGIVSVAVALGALELGVAEHHDPLRVEPILLVIVLGALAVNRRRGRLEDLRKPGVGGSEGAERCHEESAWQTTFRKVFREVRPLPAAVEQVQPVRVARWVLLSVVGWLALSLPMTLTPEGRSEATTLLAYILLGLSLVLLSGWAGRLSLGQVGYFAVGAAVGAWTVLRWDADLVVALVAAGAAGALASLVVGVPVLRLPGRYLAVTTLAFAVAASALLDPQVFDWVPEGHVERAPLIAGWDVAAGGFRAYYLVLVIVAVTMAGVYHLRRSSQLARALTAFRDGQGAARSSGVDPVAVQLIVYTSSGALAAVAGALLVHSEETYEVGWFGPLESVAVLGMMVIGGITTVAGAVLGAFVLMGARWLLPSEWEMLAVGGGMLLVLLYLPGGLAAVVYDVRDRVVRMLARQGPVGGLDALDTSDAKAAAPTRQPDRTEAQPGPAARADGAAGSDDAARAGEAGDDHDPKDLDGADTAGDDDADENDAGEDHDAVVYGDDWIDSARAASVHVGPLLQVSDAEAGVDGIPVLRGVDLAVELGEVVALVGVNGAGKTTLLRVVSGLVPLTCGGVAFDGQPVGGEPAHRIADLGLAQVPSSRGVFPNLTVAENLRVACWLHRYDADTVAACIDRAVGFFPELGERAAELAGRLPTGDSHKLALAMAVASRPKLVMIDELALGGAPATVRELARVVGHLRKEGVTVVLVPQSAGAARRLADRLVHLEGGRIPVS